MKKHTRSRTAKTYTATPSELRAIKKGEAAFRRGEYVTLNEFFKKDKAERRPKRR